ncbi:substrate-binding domain-containing protein [Frankia tisae]|uniref:substrate-binding domain-containing protein n=1 Tax=Frankia tisae TaxID=2950104 RepID=UPI0021C0E156|nr:substrate-binding domain-containing protein [Frankia tisae]
MRYQLGISPGVDVTTAAIAENGWPSAFAAEGEPQIPTVLHLAPDGTVRIGRSAARLRAGQPEQTADGFVHWLGDSTPILVGGIGYTASALLARFLDAVIRTATAQRGQPPELVVVTCPATWPARRQEGLADALARLETAAPVVARSSAEAMAALFSQTTPVADGRGVATYQLGSHWFEAAVFTATAGGYVPVGSPVGLADVSTSMLDDLLYAHVAGLVGDGGGLRGGPRASADGARLGAACAGAREVLAEETFADIAVPTGDATTVVQVSRDDYESLVRPLLDDSIRALSRAVRAAASDTGALGLLAVYGPGARIPLVSRLLGEHFPDVGRLEIRHDGEFALGAALLGARDAVAEPANSETVLLGPAAFATIPPPSAPPVIGHTPPPEPAPSGPPDPRAVDGASHVPVPGGASAGAAAAASGEGAQASAAGGRRRWSAGGRPRRRLLAGVLALVVFIAGSVTLGLFLTGGGDGTSVTAALPRSTVDQHPQLPADTMRAAERAAGIVGGAGVGRAGVGGGAVDANAVITTGSAEVAAITGTAYSLFRESAKGVTVRVGSTDTDDGFQQVCAGQADIVGASYALSDKACGARVAGFEIAHHLLPIVVSRQNTWVQCLTAAQVGRIWARDSTVTTWNQVDPSFPNVPLSPIGPAASTVHAKVFLASMTGSSTNTRAYETRELDEIPARVDGDRGAIAFMDYSNFLTTNRAVRAIKLDSGRGCVEPNALTAGTGMYMPLCKPLYLYANKASLRKPAVAAFLRYYLQNQKEITSQAHYIARDDATVRDNIAIVQNLTAGVPAVKPA